MTDRTRNQWEALGRNDPYWAVLADPGKKGGRWDRKEFFQSGIDEIEQVMQQVRSLGVALRTQVALDFGCGVGRVTEALAPRFERVLGVDFAASMLDEARARSRAANVAYLRNDGHDLAAVPAASVDFLYSNISLQHAPRAVQRTLVREFCRVLRQGALLVFQTPSHADRSSWRGWAHLVLGNRALNHVRRLLHGRGRVMEIHALPRVAVLDILRECGMTVLEVRRHDSAGAAFVGYRYFARKEAA